MHSNNLHVHDVLDLLFQYSEHLSCHLFVHIFKYLHVFEYLHMHKGAEFAYFHPYFYEFSIELSLMFIVKSFTGRFGQIYAACLCTAAS